MADKSAALRIKPNGEIDRIALDEDDLPALQALVGGWVEALPLHGEWAGHLLYVAEEGRLLHMERNWRATLLAGRAIVGTAILVRVNGASLSRESLVAVASL